MKKVFIIYTVIILEVYSRINYYLQIFYSSLFPLYPNKIQALAQQRVVRNIIDFLSAMYLFVHRCLYNLYLTLKNSKHTFKQYTLLLLKIKTKLLQ